MNSLNNFKRSWSFFYKNKYGLLIGASVLHFVMSVAGINVLFWVFQLILLFSNQENLTKDNFYLIFSNPLSLLFCAIYILLVAFLTFAEFFILIKFINARRASDIFSVRKVFFESFKKNNKRVTQKSRFQRNRFCWVTPAKFIRYLKYFYK